MGLFLIHISKYFSYNDLGHQARLSVHVRARVYMGVKKRRIQKEKQLASLHLDIAASTGVAVECTHSDINIKHDHHPQPSLRRGPPHANCVDF